MVAAGAYLLAQAGIIALERDQFLVVREDIIGTFDRCRLERLAQAALARGFRRGLGLPFLGLRGDHRSEEHTSELQSLMRISYAVFCLKKTTVQMLTRSRHKQE